MKRKITAYLIVFYLTISCSSYKYEYVPTSEATAIGLSKSLEGTLKKEELFLSFTKSFQDSKIEILENDSVIFNGSLNSTDKHIAKAFKINSQSKVTIKFGNIKEPLVLIPEQMKNYKFIYLEKKRNRVVIEFNNGTKNFNGKPILDL